MPTKKKAKSSKRLKKATKLQPTRPLKTHGGSGSNENPVES